MYFDGHQLYDQRLARALSCDRRVLYVEPAAPIFVDGRAKGVVSLGLRNADAKGITVFTPIMIPFGRRRGLYSITGLLTALQVWAALLCSLKSFTFDLIVVAINPVVARLFPTGRAVHLVKDDYLAGGQLMGIGDKQLVRRFRSVMSSARKVVVVSPWLQQTLLTRGFRSEVVPAGCTIPTKRHPEPADLQDVRRPRAVFVGMLSDRIDLTYIEEIAHAGLDIVIVGQVQNTFSKGPELKRLVESGRLHLLEPRRGEDLEAVIQHCHVGLIPYALSEFNNASFPLKAFEYLACGLDVVSSPLPSMVWLDFAHIRLASSPESFAAAALDAVKSPSSRAAECVDFAAKNTWSDRGDRFRRLLAE